MTREAYNPVLTSRTARGVGRDRVVAYVDLLKPCSRVARMLSHDPEGSMIEEVEAVNTHEGRREVNTW